MNTEFHSKSTKSTNLLQLWFLKTQNLPHNVNRNTNKPLAAKQEQAPIMSIKQTPKLLQIQLQTAKYSKIFSMIQNIQFTRNGGTLFSKFVTFFFFFFAFFSKNFFFFQNWIKLFTEGFSKFFLWRSVVRKLLVDFYFCPKTDISKTSPLAFFVPNTKQDKSNPQKSIIPDVPLDKQHLINDKIIDLYAAPLRIPGTASNLIEFSSKNARGDELFHSQIYALFLKGYGNPKLFSDSFSNVIVFGEEDRHVPIAQGRELLNDLKRELGTRKGVCKVDGNECADKVVLKVIPQACHNPQETHILETKEILLH